MDDMGRTTRNKEDASSGLDIFKKLNEEVIKPLHKECGSMTRMAFIIKELHIKTYMYDQQDIQYALSTVESCFAIGGLAEILP